MKNKILKVMMIMTSALPLTALALPIAEYDLFPATGTSLAPSYVDSNFTASDLVLNNADNSAAAFDNHFYHNGWDTTFNANKFYEATISSDSAYVLDLLIFSLEELFEEASQYWLRTSLDGFTADVDTGMFGGEAAEGLVTDFAVDLSSLGILNGATTFRWYMTADEEFEQAGFANHQCTDSILGAGCGFEDVGQDLIFNGNLVAVPEPGTLVLLGLGLAGIGFSRRRKRA